MLVALLDLYFACPRGDRTGLEPDRAVNEPGLPVLVLVRDGGREYVAEVDAVDIHVVAHNGLNEYLRQVRRRESRWLKDLDIVVTGQGLYPFREG